MWWCFAAFAADLNGWDGIPWGSTKGGPKDPAMASDPAVVAKRTIGGTVGLMQFAADLRTPMGELPKSTFAGVPVVGAQVLYFDGEAAAFVAVLPFGTNPAGPTEALVKALGAPSASGAGWMLFDLPTASVAFQIDRLTVRSKAATQRCAEAFGASCELLRPGETAP